MKNRMRCKLTKYEACLKALHPRTYSYGMGFLQEESITYVTCTIGSVDDINSYTVSSTVKLGFELCFYILFAKEAGLRVTPDHIMMEPVKGPHVPHFMPTQYPEAESIMFQLTRMFMWGLIDFKRDSSGKVYIDIGDFKIKRMTKTLGDLFC
jgi:hypothetical protein